MTPRPAEFRFAFAIEQTLGHVVHTAMLRRYAYLRPRVTIEWGLVTPTPGPRSWRRPHERVWTVQAGLLARRFCAEALRSGPIDAIFCHTQAVGLLASNYRGLPTVVSIDVSPRQYCDMQEHYGRRWGGAAGQALRDAAFGRMFRSVAAVVCCAAWVRDDLVRTYGVPAERVHVVPWGIDLERWARSETTWRPRTDSAVRIAFVGNAFERKGGPDLLTAFRRLRARGRPVELHVVGAWNGSSAVDDGVFVYGALPHEELPSLLHRCDLFCLPTLADCVPIAVAEASAAGLPVVATRLAAIPEMVIDGQTGFLVPPRDIDALTEALDRLVLDATLRRAFGRAGAVKAASFDAGTTTAAVLDTMIAVAERARSGG